jgi:hypothetical protein
VSAALLENKAAKAAEIISGNHPERCAKFISQRSKTLWFRAQKL